MKYQITYSCGHTGTVELYGKNIDRESKIMSLKKQVCPVCHEAKVREAAKDIKGLYGSNAQVVWAADLKESFIKKVDEYIDKNKKKMELFCRSNPDRAEEAQKGFKEGKFLALEARDYLIQKKKTASWWIDNRDTSILILLKETSDAIVRKREESQSIRDSVKENVIVKAASTVTPEKVTHLGAVEVSCQDNKIFAKYDYDEYFRKIMREKELVWDKGRQSYVREITEFSGPVVDRAVELANILLTKGFSVRIYDEGIRERAVKADFEPECKKWVTLRASGKYAGWFSIFWPKGHQEIYDAARKIHGSRWDGGKVVVPIDWYKDVEDFADIMGFKISEKAQQAIKSYVLALPTSVIPKMPQAQDQVNKLKEILSHPATVIEDLKDD